MVDESLILHIYWGIIILWDNKYFLELVLNPGPLTHQVSALPLSYVTLSSQIDYYTSGLVNCNFNIAIIAEEPSLL